MAETRKIVKAFLASPGDLADERKAVKSLIDEVNELIADECGYQIELVGWEDTVSVFGRPQAIINRELARCELFIGLMWRQWGSAPDTAGPYSSGFEEEFRSSVARRISEGRPEISLFFKEVDSASLRDPGDGLKKVIAFKDELIAGKQILFENFSSIRELERKVRRCITAYVFRLRQEEQERLPISIQSPTESAKSDVKDDSSDLMPNSLFSVEGADFLRRFVVKAAKNQANDQITAVEVARFRLLASFIRLHGNDDSPLGVHDANLLYRKRLKFGKKELVGLFESALTYYRSENVPLWRWYFEIDGNKNGTLGLNSVSGSAELRVGAINAMTLISEPISVDDELPRSFYLQKWFGSSLTVRNAALKYLAQCGVENDLTEIRKEFEKGESQTVSAAAEAIVRIYLKVSREKAIDALYDLQPASISRIALDELFRSPEDITDRQLLAGIGHRCSDVRRIVAAILRSRKELSAEVVQQLLSDNDAYVRYEALQAQIDNGTKYGEDEAKIVLTKPSLQRGSALGLRDSADSVGLECWNTFREQRLRSLSDTELEEETRKEWFSDRDAYFVLAERYFKKHCDHIRGAFDDGYKSEFEKSILAMGEERVYAPDIVDKWRSLEDFVRKQLSEKAARLICTKGGAEDLGRVRKLVESCSFKCQPAAINFLRKFGEWDDILLIIKMVEQNKNGRLGLTLLASDSDMHKIASKAIYSLGRERIVDLLKLNMPNSLFCYLMVLIPDRAFGRLPVKVINRLFTSENDNVRKVAALKSIRAFPKVHIEKMLNNFLSGDDKTYYYNVVHWLDLAVSVPRARVMRATERVLATEW